MTTLKKTTLAALVGAAALASAGAANAAITLADVNGFKFTTDGEINQFYVHTRDKATGGHSSNQVRDGLLPGFLGFNITAPEVNGLKLGARVSISPSTNAGSYTTSNGGAMEQREAYFTVDGSFGQVLMGKALGLYGSHNILTDQTLYGVGWGTTGANGTTTLGGIGLGYDYAGWRSQIRWTSPDMNGFKVALAIANPAGGAVKTAAGYTGDLSNNTVTNSNSLRYEGDLSYAGAFDGGSYSLWLSGMTQNHSLSDFGSSTTGNAADARAWTVGGTLKANGFEGMAQYSDSRDTAVASHVASKADWQQYILQAGYRFAGTTLASLSYAHLHDNAHDKTRRYTFGIYHDVSKNLKLVAEYTRAYNDLNSANLDQDIFSLGGFVSW